MIFRKATQKDISAVAEIYSDVHTAEEQGLAVIGWVREIYPTAETARAAQGRGDLFVAEVCLNEFAEKDMECENCGESRSAGSDGDSGKKKIVGTAIINKSQVDVYEGAPWKYLAPENQVMVLHTLVIDPKESGKGYGAAFVRFYEQYALKHGCLYLRMDTIAINARARALYKKLGYTEIDIVPCVLNGIENVPLVLLEKKLEG